MSRLTCVILVRFENLIFGVRRIRWRLLRHWTHMWWGTIWVLIFHCMSIRYYVNTFNICTLILLQTDSSPSMSFAQLTKVLFLNVPLHNSRKNIAQVELSTLSFLLFSTSCEVDNPLFFFLSLQTANLVDANASEEDKIKAMMTQSNHEYDPIQLVYKHTFTSEIKHY